MKELKDVIEAKDHIIKEQNEDLLDHIETLAKKRQKGLGVMEKNWMNKALDSDRAN